MIYRLYISILFYLSLLNCNAQISMHSLITMEAYSRKIVDLEVKMFVDKDVNELKTYWGIYIYNSKSDSILIDHFEYSGIYEKEQEYIAGDIRKRIIIGDVILVDKTIYLMFYNYGKTFLNTYEFIESKKFIKNEYFGGQLAIGSYLNFGHPFYKAEIKSIAKNEIYIKFAGGTEVFSGNGNVTLLKFDNLKKKLVRIVFNETPKYIIKDSDKFFETFDSDKEKLSAEIKKVLIDSKFIKEVDDFKYIDFLYDYSVQMDLEQINKIKGGMIYLFYRVDQIAEINIIRYDNYKSEWLIGDFKEEQIQF